MEEEKWKKISKKVSNRYEWNCIPAIKENIKGRAKGGIITAIRKDLEGIKAKEINKGAMEISFIYNKNRWRIVTVYSQNNEETMDKIRKEIEEEKEDYLLLGGDFNARTGEEGGPIGMGNRTERKEEEKRRSKDKVINGEGRVMLNKIRERGWMILNGSFEKEGGWTYIGELGTSVIDYVVSNEKAIEEVKKVKEGNRTESDHVPMEVELEGKEKRKRKEDNMVKVERSIWSEEGVEYYHGKCKGWGCKKTENGEIWKELEEKVRDSIMKVEKRIIPWKLGKKEWHSKVWKTKKRELRKELRKLKKGIIDRGEYVEKRKEYRKWCEEEKRKHEEEEEQKIKLIRTEEEAWKYINKFRKKREGIDENIEMEIWNAHFMELLGGKKEKMTMEEERKEEEEIQRTEEENEEISKEDEEISKEELVRQLKKLKKGKAPGENGIENEAWRLMSEEVGEVFWRLINKIWKEGGIPEEWNKGLISPIYKKGEKGEAKNYRGVTLMDTAYKIYANILNERLKKETERKLGEGQFGFREGRGTTDAIYVLNYIANREAGKKRGKIFAFFADLKAAFDKVDRRKLGEILKRIKIGERLRKRIMETYKETKNTVKAGKRKSEEFWTSTGVRQGCPMSPTLFNIYIMDLEAEMRKEQTGGIVVGKEKFWTITYADDIVLVAQNEQDLKGMIKRFKKYLEKKDLILSPEKSKVMVFERGRGRVKKRDWRWGEESIEEVKEMRYLGYIMQKNGGAEKHIMERIRRATIAMKMTWSIGERLFRDDYIRRMKMFNALVGSIALYGAEIWGWNKEERIDRIKRKYVKWTLGLDRRTPNYILKEETKMKELRMEAMMRAIKYEETARKTEKKLVVECIKELERERRSREESKWERRRREVLEEAGISNEEWNEKREKEETKKIAREIKERIERKEEQVRRKKIEDSKYNETYKNIMTEGTPLYLKGKRNKKERNMIARYRCGSETRGSKHWLEEAEKKCRICGEGTENIVHILKECEETKDEMTVEEFLKEDGSGREMMKRIDKIREGKRREEKGKESEG